MNFIYDDEGKLMIPTPLLDKYDITFNEIGSGSVARVYKGQLKDDRSKDVAIKAMSLLSVSQDMPKYARREITALMNIKHENVIELLDFYRSKGQKNNLWRSSVYLVMEFCNYVLLDLLFTQKVIFTMDEVKNVTFQMLRGLSFIHSKELIHRDFKSDNVFINSAGVVKISDFGMSRFRPARQTREEPVDFTNNVVTYLHRAPELLLGATKYSFEIDVWSAGCMVVEMAIRDAMFFGRDLDQVLLAILNAYGKIKWFDIKKLPLYRELVEPHIINSEEKNIQEHENFQKILDPLLRDLTAKLLTPDPRRRIKASMALKHEVFREEPKPADLTTLFQRCLKTNP